MAAVRQVWSLWRGFSQAGVRSYAAPANVELAKPPIQLFGVEGRYAHALYSAAYQSKKVMKVESELLSLEKIMTEHEKLSAFMNDPTLNKRQKNTTIRGVLSALKFSDLTINLFSVLIDNNRLRRSMGVIKAYKILMGACRGEVHGVITSAKPVSDRNKEELKKVLQKFLQKNEVLSLEVKVDPSLIGGIVVALGDKYIDMSTQTRIKKIMATLSEAV